MLINRKKHLIINKRYFIVVKRNRRLLNEIRDCFKRLFNVQ